MTSKPHRYSLYLRERIIRLSKSNTIQEIIEKLRKDDQVTVNESGVRRLIRRYSYRHNIQDAPRTGRPIEISSEIKNFVEVCMMENNEFTACQIVNKISLSFNVSVTPRSINRIRNELGWRPAHPKYCQIVRDANKLKRLDFCTKILLNPDLLKKIIFTDESCIQLERHKRVLWKKQDDKLMVLRSKAKYPVKVHVWAGISWCGATQIVIMPDKTRINSKIYQDILSKGLLPFVKENYPNGDYIFQADSAPAHKSGDTLNFVRKNNLPYDPLFWPPESPDLNAIENLWHELKEFLRGTKKPNNLRELQEGIGQFWSEKVTKEKCQKYIKHVLNVVPCVFENKGGPTLY